MKIWGAFNSPIDDYIPHKSKVCAKVFLLLTRLHSETLIVNRINLKMNNNIILNAPNCHVYIF